MISNTKKATNRANASSSTGPRTNPGKSRSSRNAFKHGLEARRLVLPDESTDEYFDFVESVTPELSPLGMAEEYFANRAADLAWRLRRASRAEASIFLAEHKSQLQQQKDLDHRRKTETRIADFLVGQESGYVDLVQHIRRCLETEEQIDVGSVFSRP